MLSIFFDIKEIVLKEFDLEGRTILHATVMFYSDCLKMCEDFVPELWRQTNWLLHHEKHCFAISFSPANF
jgi:hypothetical protein